MTPEIKNFITRATDRLGIHREKFTDKDVTNSLNKIKIWTFFGDLRSEFLLSTMLMHRLINPHDYNILCSWSGHSGLYPYINEYWSPRDCSELASHVSGFGNTSLINYEKLLLRYFEQVGSVTELVAPYFNHGFTKRYINELQTIQYRLPNIPILPEHGKAPFVFVYPSKIAHRWNPISPSLHIVNKSFWEKMIQELLNSGLGISVMQDEGSFDISPIFGQKCHFVDGKNILGTLSAMRNSACVLDVFSGIYRLAMIARSPFFMVDERQRYFNLHDNEIDTICTQGVPHDKMFSFASLMEEHPTSHLAQAITNRIHEFIDSRPQETLPPAGEINRTIPYDQIRKSRQKFHHKKIKFFRMQSVK